MFFKNVICYSWGKPADKNSAADIGTSFVNYCRGRLAMRLIITAGHTISRSLGAAWMLRETRSILFSGCRMGVGPGVVA